MKTALSVNDISKQYTLGSEVAVGQSFREMITSSLSAPFRKYKRLSGSAKKQDLFWALKDISFEVQPGEVVGIIGRNGAGKSTLLKVLSRITTPTEGSISYRGRLASLLEVGTGFHPELTGRENIYLNGAILGMKRLEITSRLDEIVAFANIEKFLDTPVKRYSSGMYVRLAFSVAAHLDPEILIVDEVLSVGDAKFQNKCIGKMNEVATEGRTVLFVSHNLAAVRKLCTSIKILDHGRMVFEGNVSEGMAVYEDSIGNHYESVKDAEYKGTLRNIISFESIRYSQEGNEVNTVDSKKELKITLVGQSQKHLYDVDLSVALYRDGVHVTSLYDTTSSDKCINKGLFTSTFKVSKDTFTSGRYTLSVGAINESRDWVSGQDVSMMNVASTSNTLSNRHSGLIDIKYSAQRFEAEKA